ncbi:hypothetical protein [Streptomyces boluensis]|uniref:Uncharacterized protein n=1 Tax=Streptomyces boluensis TaxID=1775135 RepID=A0A964XNX8_9ACTN|nr:hypothetical protein [Streptomyces boluensis]NBE54651.1 hypothetical protein [Streptomyces boluensis]
MVLALTAIVSACATSPEEPRPVPIKPVAADAICGDMFAGDVGRDLQKLLTGRNEFYPRTRSEATRVERVAQQMRKEVSGGSSPKFASATSVCSFLLCKEDVRTPCGGEREIDFPFGWTRHPHFTGDEQSETLDFVAGDAALSLAVDEHSGATTRFPCRLPGGYERAVQGYFEGTWSNDLGMKAEESARLKALLSAASKMSRALGCTNHPRPSPSAEIRQTHDD